MNPWQAEGIRVAAAMDRPETLRAATATLPSASVQEPIMAHASQSQHFDIQDEDRFLQTIKVKMASRLMRI